MIKDIVKGMREKIRKGYELGGGELCIVSARDLDCLLAELERLQEELNAAKDHR